MQVVPVSGQYARLLGRLQAAVTDLGRLATEVQWAVGTLERELPPTGLLRVASTGVVLPLRRFATGLGDAKVGRLCIACRAPLREGDRTTLLALGPGADHEQRALARAGQPYSAVVLHLHYACVTGSDEGEGAA